MKLLIDPEIFFYGRCGMVRYYSALIKQFELKGIEIDLPLVASGSDFIDGHYQSLFKVRDILPKGKNLYNNVLNKFSKKWYYKKLQQDNFDAVFLTSPVFEDGFFSRLPQGKPVIMVVHDTMRCVLGADGLFDPAGSNADRLAYLINRVDIVVAISEQTKRDIINLTGVDEKRVKVIHTGNLLQLEQERKPEQYLPSRYLLFVGDRTGRKNFRFFIHSVAGWLKEQSDLFFVCTGSTNEWEQDLLIRLGVQDKVLFLDAPDEVLVYLYKNALGLIFPSLYEGFGLPVLEAMSLGCPVLTSTNGALQEVGGDAVIYVDPNDAQSILDGVKIIVAPSKARVLSENGLVQAKKFTLEKMVAEFEKEFVYLVQKQF